MLEKQLKAKIQQLRDSLASAYTCAIKDIAEEIEALESFLRNYIAYGLRAVDKTDCKSLHYLLGINEELTAKAEECINTFETLLPSIKEAMRAEIKEVFNSCKYIDFADIKQLSAWDVKHEELHCLRYYLNQIDFYTLPAWCENIRRMDTELIRRCFLHLSPNQRAILERYL
jgi:hypothetical protein